MEDEKVIQKYYPNSFKETDLLDYLKSYGLNEVVITGMMTHTCVDSTTRTAKDIGFDCTIIGTTCASRDLENAEKIVKAEYVHDAFLSTLTFFYAKVQNAEEYLSV